MQRLVPRWAMEALLSRLEQVALSPTPTRRELGGPQLVLFLVTGSRWGRAGQERSAYTGHMGLSTQGPLP